MSLVGGWWIHSFIVNSTRPVLYAKGSILKAKLESSHELSNLVQDVWESLWYRFLCPLTLRREIYPRLMCRHLDCLSVIHGCCLHFHFCPAFLPPLFPPPPGPRPVPFGWYMIKN